MKFFKLLLIIFISFTTSIKADLNQNLKKQLEGGGKIIFIRHAFAPGNGDPENFNLNDCSTQRNLNKKGKTQAINIGKFFIKNKVQIDKIISSEWCRCKDTAYLAFKKYETKNFLNSFYSSKYVKNRDRQILELKNYIKLFKSKKNLILVTHYVVILDILDYAPSSGEIIISDKNFKKIGSIEIDY